jgi:hypothetical protein
MELLRRYPLVSALAILAGVLVLVLALEYASSAALHEKVSGTATSQGVPVQTKLLPPIPAVNPEQEYAETGARPLFIPTRRPAPVLAQANVGTMAKGQFILTGVISAGGMKIALLREKASGRVVRVEQGKDVNGITVAQIEPEQVTLAQGGDQEVVPLLVTKGVAPTPTAPVPDAAAGPFAAPAARMPRPAQSGRATACCCAAAARSHRGTRSGWNPTSPSVPPRRPHPGNSYIPPAPDPTTGTPPTSQAAPLTPEEPRASPRAPHPTIAMSDDMIHAKRTFAAAALSRSAPARGFRRA